MAAFEFESTGIKGLLLVHPFFVRDERGYFAKSYEKGVFRAQGIEADIFEMFESHSVHGVVRGLHFQTKKPQAKLVQALDGVVFDVAVDLRPGSATFGKWQGFTLDAGSHKAVYISPGLAHGFKVLSPSARVLYLCAGEYLKDYDTGIRWDDSDIGIAWPGEAGETVLVSPRDQGFPSFKEYCAAAENGGGINE